MKNPKFPYYALAFVVFFVGLFIVWLNRFDYSSDFREFRSAVRLSFTGENEQNESSPDERQGDMQDFQEQQIVLEMSDEEKDFYRSLEADFPSFEEISQNCQQTIANLEFESISIDGATLNFDKAEALTNKYVEGLMSSFDGPSAVYDHIFYFIRDSDSVNPSKLYELLNQTSSLCIDREMIQRLRNTIEQAHTLGWSQIAKYKFSVLVEPMLYFFQTIHSPERMLLYINTIEAMEQYGFITFEANTSFNAIRTRLEDFHQKIVADLQDESLTVSQKHLALREYVSEMVAISAELSESAMQGIRRIMPET